MADKSLRRSASRSSNAHWIVAYADVANPRPEVPDLEFWAKLDQGAKEDLAEVSEHRRPGPYRFDEKTAPMPALSIP